MERVRAPALQSARSRRLRLNDFGRQIGWFAVDCAISQSVRVLRRSLAARPASRAFPGRRGVDSEPETVPGAPRAPKPAPRSLFRDGQVRFRWRGLGSADAEQRRLRRPGDRQVEGADQAMRDQLRRLLSQPQ
jgi:hypothetical protein